MRTVPFRSTPSALLLAVLVVVFALSGCATTGVNQGDFNLVSLEEEWALGRQLEADLAKQLTFERHSGTQQYVERLGQALVARTAMARLPWKFHVVRDPDINAFNIPGGHVYVNTGLLAAAPDAASLAGVMAHEISHGVARHGTEQLSKAYGLQMVAGLVLGENPAVYQQILAQVAAGGALASFSRDAEREADGLGVRTMHAASYEPEGMARMFEVLLSQRNSRPGGVQKFFSSHPLTENRIRDVRAAAAALPTQPNEIGDEAAFRQVRSRYRN